MALPSATKTWQYDVNQTSSGGSVEACVDAVWLALVASLKGFGTNPWTVWGSCDGAAAGNGDTTDRWLDAGDLVHANPASSHSWMVLYQAQLGLYVCFNLRSTTAQNAEVVCSLAGFGVANGGTDGTTSARPTATDEIITRTVAAMFHSSPDTYQLHVMQSTDGLATRVVLCRNNFATWSWVFDQALSTVGGWAGEIVSTRCTPTADAATYAAYNDAAEFSAWIGGTAVTMYSTCEGYVSGMVGQNLTIADEDTGEWPIEGVGLVCGDVGHRGRKGAVADLYWGSTAVNTGDHYPADASRTMVQFGDFVCHWNGTAALVS